MKVIKSNTYNLIDTRPFEMPLPLNFKLYNDGELVADYAVNFNKSVTRRIGGGADADIVMNGDKPLTINDIYYLFSSRVIPNNTPYTYGELMRLGLNSYNPYEIARKTHGILPYDKLWIRFEGEAVDYNAALMQFRGYYAAPMTYNSGAPQTQELTQILSQHKVDFDELNRQVQTKASVDSHKLSFDELSRQVQAETATFETAPSVEHKAPPVEESHAEAASSGEKLNDDQIAELFRKMGVQQA